MCQHNSALPRRVRILILVISVLLVTSVRAQEDSSTWFDRQSDWQGFDRYHFAVADHPAYLVVPQTAAPGRPWVWRARFPDYHAEMDVALLKKGFHVAYVDVTDLFGSPAAMEIMDRLYERLTIHHGLAPKVALEGVSRGGLFVYNWANRHPARVACIYADTPVLDIKSWPGGKGDGLGSSDAWQKCLAAYQLSEAEAMEYSMNPIDHAQVLAAAKIPLLHVVAENDQVVPPKENTYVLQQRLKELGHSLEVISLSEGTTASHGHHFDHPDPDRVVAFIETHTAQGLIDRQSLLHDAKRVVFLGDSITYSGEYVNDVVAWLWSEDPESMPEVINVGLPSETVSGLSEEGHAGGRFPRPDLAERLDRVLDVTKPDLVFACYGINCGIYQPLDASRLESYQQGVRHLREQVKQAGATLVLITPPTFDDRRAAKLFSYNEVLDKYSEWLLTLRDEGTLVIDLHGPMSRELLRRRQADPEFTFQPDAVHPNSDGHWLMAQVLIGWFGDAEASLADSPTSMLAAAPAPAELLAKVRQQQVILRDAYLTAAGHKRPGISKGMPLEEANAQVDVIQQSIQQMLKK